MKPETSTKRLVKKEYVRAIEGIKSPTFKRIAYRSDIKRVSEQVYAHCRIALYEFLKKLIHDSFVNTDNGKRKLVSASDVISAADKNGIKLKKKIFNK